MYGNHLKTSKSNPTDSVLTMGMGKWGKSNQKAWDFDNKAKNRPRTCNIMGSFSSYFFLVNNMRSSYSLHSCYSKSESNQNTSIRVAPISQLPNSIIHTQLVACSLILKGETICFIVSCIHLRVFLITQFIIGLFYHESLAMLLFSPNRLLMSVNQNSRHQEREPLVQASHVIHAIPPSKLSLGLYNQ